MTDLFDRYERALKDPVSDIVDYLPVFYEMAQRDDVTNVIELGVREANSTVAWLAGLEGHGHLWSVDVEPMHDPALNEVEGWTFIHGGDLDPLVLAQLPEKVDVVFIDTDHAYNQTVRELDCYASRVRPGGCILLHDTELEHPEDHGVRIPPQPAFPVKQALRMFASQRRWVAKLDERGYGLGWLMVP